MLIIQVNQKIGDRVDKEQAMGQETEWDGRWDGMGGWDGNRMGWQQDGMSERRVTGSDGLNGIDDSDGNRTGGRMVWTTEWDGIYVLAFFFLWLSRQLNIVIPK